MVTLEISSTVIRLLETAGGKVTRWASRSLEPGVVEQEVVTDAQALGAAVRQLMESSGIRARNVTASVSGLYSLSRIVMVPTPPGGSATQEAVLEAAEEVMPLSEEELYLSWQPIATSGGEHQVLVIGAPRDVIDSEMQALRAVGINPNILDLKTMALARAVNREQALILNIEPTSFDTVLVINGVTTVMRTIAWQSDDLSTEDKAEQLAIALELTAGFHDSHNPNLPLAPSTPLFITGQMSGDLTLVERLQARVEYPIEPFAPPLEYPEHLPVSQYAVTIGLALKRRAASRDGGQGSLSLPDMNLLPPVYYPWRPSTRQVYTLLTILAAIALLFPLYQATSGVMTETANLENRYNAMNGLLEARQAKIREREPLQKAITEYNTIVSVRSSFAEDLEAIRSLAKELGIQVSSIAHEGSQITIACQADSYTDFRAYQTALVESGRFSIASSPSEQFPYRAGGTITLAVKPNK